MKLEKILFVGLGGAGQRHLRVFHSLLGEKCQYLTYRKTKKTPTLNADFSVNESASLQDLYGVTAYSDYDQALAEKPDLVVIATPTSLHIEQIKKAIAANASVLVEKPLGHTTKGTLEIFAEAKKRQKRIITSYQRRFNPPLARLKELFEKGQTGKIINAHFNTFSYVPMWHKYEDFNELYACKKELGGGVLLTEIHEVDLCCWYLGLPRSVYCSGGNLSEHKLDVEDTVNMILQYDKFSVSFSISFMSKSCERNFFFKTDKGGINWNEEGNHLSLDLSDLKVDQSFADFGMNHMFEAQAKALIEDNKDWEQADEFTALAALKVIEAAKESMATKSVVAIS